MWPVQEALTEEDVFIRALAGRAEAPLNGTTTILEHYFFMDKIAQATIELGIRRFLGHTIMNRL